VVVPVSPTRRHRRNGTDVGEEDAHGQAHGLPDRARQDRHLKAVQKLLGHSSITTTGDIYTEWDIDQLEQTIRDVVGEDT